MPFVECFAFAQRACIRLRFRPKCLLSNASHSPKEPLVWGSYCLYAYGFRFYFTPLSGFFSPFPHGTGSLSVTREYLALRDGSPGFQRNFTCSAVLRIHFGGNILSITGL